jgi:hypothetical protein
VKARHFVLALRDYFTDQINATEVPTTSPSSTDNSPSADNGPEAKFLNNSIDPNDRWALEYINITQIQPILEAIDDDNSGFISIKEANTFAIQRPKGWT